MSSNESTRCGPLGGEVFTAVIAGMQAPGDYRAAVVVLAEY